MSDAEQKPVAEAFQQRVQLQIGGLVMENIRLQIEKETAEAALAASAKSGAKTKR